MAFLWSKVIRNAALRVSAIKGATESAKQTAFGTVPLTSAQAGSVNFPLAAIEDAAISNVGRLVRAYAQLKNHPFRLFNLSPTANIAHRGQIPFVNAANKPIVGAYGAIRNAATGEVMTEQPAQIIERLKTNADSFFKDAYNYYKIVDGRLYHTAANAVIDVCTFDETTERAALAAGSCPLPDALFDAAWAGVLSFLVIDDEFTAQAQVYENYVQNCLNQMAGGVVDIAPAPSHLDTAAPGVS